MNKKLIVILVIVFVVIFFYLYLKGVYNSMVTKGEQISAQWANVESAYQRRMDLIPNLVNTVKGYAAHEKETLEGVIEARSKATSVNINAENMNAESFQKFQQAQEGLSSALQKLMVVVERYPDLKANQNFLELQSQLEGTENRINTERRKFNETVQTYNAYIKRFPNNMFASMFGFAARDYFKSDPAATQAPKVEF
ncbi:MAG: LemA family protein [Bacteroidetes bacterium ADurb.Bin408]|nr:MAG: LemA family protein [Bacteroidetes bacterium ADurb.Bin408]